MSGSVRVMWNDALTAYNFGPGHPLAPIRVELTIRLADALGLLHLPNVAVDDDLPTDDDLVELVHQPDYIAAVRRAGSDPTEIDPFRGLGTGDNPVFPGMHEASALVVGATVAAADAVWRGDSEHAVNIMGGLHHAMPGGASGFCVYNDPAAGIARLLDLGAERVAYVDVDVHHGDGVQAIFYDDPRVLTISIHETGRMLFPGTGFPDETGGPGAEGMSVNLALPPGTDDSGWLRAFHAVVPPLVAAFRPEVLVTQHGCDSHVLDPLAHLALTVDGQRASYAALHALAHEHAGGRWLATGGGGYQVVRVVPRAWSHLIAEVAGRPIAPDQPVPDRWREHVEQRTTTTPPPLMSDGSEPRYADFAEGHDPAFDLDRSIVATRKAVFPVHGLDPLDVR